jgi:hypothetical protein
MQNLPKFAQKKFEHYAIMPTNREVTYHSLFLVALRLRGYFFQNPYR